MAINRFLGFIMAATVVTFIAGCGKTSDVASPDCVEYDKATDPSQKAELLKKCPRAASEQFRSGTYRPTPAKSY